MKSSLHLPSGDLKKILTHVLLALLVVMPKIRLALAKVFTSSNIDGWWFASIVPKSENAPIEERVNVRCHSGPKIYDGKYNIGYSSLNPM